MSIARIDNIFSQEEIDHIKSVIAERDVDFHTGLGRVQIFDIEGYLLPEIINKLNAIAKDNSDLPLEMTHAMSVEYSPLYGKPNLPPHFDGDTNDLIINIQLESNTVWDIGLNLQTYTLTDNSALVFNANKEVHWRVHKEFKEGEYVKMMFVRFYNSENRSDYSYLPGDPNNEIFKAAREFRDSYPQPNKP
jgi:hypothetical protein